MNELDYPKGLEFGIDFVKLDNITRNSPITNELLIKNWERKQEFKLTWESLYPMNSVLMSDLKKYIKTLFFSET